ncbi:MAG: transcriptional repressor LexA [Candidatus Omnitrophota bacterium]
MLFSSDLTTRQARILAFIKDQVGRTGRPPTIREIGGQFGFKSTGTTRDHLKALSRKGYLLLHPRQSRSIELKNAVAMRIPVVGRITAGMPDLALEETQGYLFLDDLMPGPEKTVFALKVKGDSMKDKGILEGDMAVIRKQRTAEPGDIVAALIENEATIKTLEKNKTGFFLKPANPAYHDIHAPFSILGKVIAVVKRF